MAQDTLFHFYCRKCKRACKQRQDVCITDCYLFDAISQADKHLMHTRPKLHNGMIMAQIKSISGTVKFQEICKAMIEGRSWSGEVLIEMNELAHLTDYCQHRIYQHIRNKMGRTEFAVDYNDLKSQVFFFVWEMCSKKPDKISNIKEEEDLMHFLKACIKKACLPNGSLMKRILTLAGYALKVGGKSGKEYEVAEIPVETVNPLDEVDDCGWDSHRYQSDYDQYYSSRRSHKRNGSRSHSCPTWARSETISATEAWKFLQDSEDMSVLVLRFKNDMTFAQIAEILNVSTRTAKTKVDKALQHLRKEAMKIPGGITTLSEITDKISKCEQEVVGDDEGKRSESK